MTPEQKLDKYYQLKFGWTLAEVDAMFAKQGNVCAACKRPPGKYRLSVDHDHVFDRIKVTTRKHEGAWLTEPKSPEDIEFLKNEKTATCAWGWPTKAENKKVLLLIWRQRSVRGGLCLRCNKGLQMFEDSKAPLPPAERLERLAAYLRTFQNKTKLSDK
jgi:hypothetical protein